MQLVYGLGLAVAGLLSMGCAVMPPAKAGSGVALTEVRQVPQFSQLRIEGSGDVEVTIGPAGPLSITADDNLMSIITTEVRGDTLVLEYRQPCQTRTPVHVTVSSPTLESAKISGSGRVSVNGMNGPRLDLHISGSGKMRATGTVERLDASISGSGSLELGELVAQDADINMSGSGEATVNVVDELGVGISGSGRVTYREHPKRLDTRISGSGRVTRG